VKEERAAEIGAGENNQYVRPKKKKMAMVLEFFYLSAKEVRCL
jgi:hypothetical protein